MPKPIKREAKNKIVLIAFEVIEFRLTQTRSNIKIKA